MTLPELIKALEAARTSSRELDADILEASGGCAHRETEYYCIEDGNDSDSGFTCKRCGKDTYGERIPAFTESVDAAMALAWKLWPECTFEIEAWPHQAIVGIALNRSEDDLTTAEAEGPIVPIAICLAVLRARLSQDGGGDE